MNLTVPFFFGMINVGAAHSEQFTLRSTVLLNNRACLLLYVELVHVFSGSEMPVHDMVLHLVEVLYGILHDSRNLEFHQTKFHIPVKHYVVVYVLLLTDECILKLFAVILLSRK